MDQPTTPLDTNTGTDLDTDDWSSVEDRLYNLHWRRSAVYPPVVDPDDA